MLTEDGIMGFQFCVPWQATAFQEGQRLCIDDLNDLQYNNGAWFLTIDKAMKHIRSASLSMPELITKWVYDNRRGLATLTAAVNYKNGAINTLLHFLRRSFTWL